MIDIVPLVRRRDLHCVRPGLGHVSCLSRCPIGDKGRSDCLLLLLLPATIMRCFVFALLLPAVFGLRSSPHRLAAHRRRSVAPVSLPLRYHEPSRGHAAALARSHQRARRAIGNNWSWSTDADGDLSIFVTDVERVTVTLAAGQPAPALVAGAARTDVPMPTPIARPSTTPNATVLRLDAAPYDAAFLATVSIGTPPQVRRSTLLVLTAQTFELSIDTGSDVTWVQSSSCTTCGGDDSLDPKSSSTLHVAAESYSVQYGIGSVEGAWASDTLRLGDSVLPDFAMLLVTAAIDSDDSSPYDGLLALSYAASEDTGGSVTPLVQALYDSKQATSRIVGIELRDGGALTLGGVDETRFITLDWMPNQSTYLCASWQSMPSLTCRGGAGHGHHCRRQGTVTGRQGSGHPRHWVHRQPWASLTMQHLAGPLSARARSGPARRHPGRPGDFDRRAVQLHPALRRPHAHLDRNQWQSVRSRSGPSRLRPD